MYVFDPSQTLSILIYGSKLSFWRFVSLSLFFCLSLFPSLSHSHTHTYTNKFGDFSLSRVVVWLSRIITYSCIIILLSFPWSSTSSSSSSSFSSFSFSSQPLTVSTVVFSIPIEGQESIGTERKRKRGQERERGRTIERARMRVCVGVHV